MLPKALKSCPKSNKSHNLVTLSTTRLVLSSMFTFLSLERSKHIDQIKENRESFVSGKEGKKRRKIWDSNRAESSQLWHSWQSGSFKPKITRVQIRPWRIWLVKYLLLTEQWRYKWSKIDRELKCNEIL